MFSGKVYHMMLHRRRLRRPAVRLFGSTWGSSYACWRQISYPGGHCLLVPAKVVFSRKHRHPDHFQENLEVMLCFSRNCWKLRGFTYIRREMWFDMWVSHKWFHPVATSLFSHLFHSPNQYSWNIYRDIQCCIYFFLLLSFLWTWKHLLRVGSNDPNSLRLPPVSPWTST